MSDECPECASEYLRTLPCGADDAYLERHPIKHGAPLCEYHTPVLGVCEDCRRVVRSHVREVYHREPEPIPHFTSPDAMCAARSFAYFID